MGASPAKARTKRSPDRPDRRLGRADPIRGTLNRWAVRALIGHGSSQTRGRAGPGPRYRAGTSMVRPAAAKRRPAGAGLRPPEVAGDVEDQVGLLAARRHVDEGD